MGEPVYIHGLRVDSFMKVALVEMKLDGPGLVAVSGQNAQGKSSLLTAIMAALGGKSALPEKPVRDGADHAEVDVDLGDKVVRLRVTPDRRSVLSVEAKDGAKYASPQALLNAIVGDLAFDPLVFATMEPKRQAETLRKLAGLDTEKLEANRARLFAERTHVNRLVKDAEAQLAAMPEVEGPDVEVSVADIAKRLRIATEEDARVADLKRKEEKAVAELNDIGRQIIALQERQMKGAQYLGSIQAQIRDAAPSAVPGITAELEGAEGVNKLVAAKRARAEKYADVVAKVKAADDLTDQIGALDAQKHDALAAAKFPLEGLGVDGDTVTFGGIPLAQASTAERLKVCLSIAAALNPALRVLLVRQGNDLDDANLRIVADFARDRGLQILVERIHSDQMPGVEIVAGRVAGAEVAPAKEPAPVTSITKKRKRTEAAMSRRPGDPEAA